MIMFAEAHPAKPCQFLSLSSEIRGLIYSFYFVRPCVTIYDASKDDWKECCNPLVPLLNAISDFDGDIELKRPVQFFSNEGPTITWLEDYRPLFLVCKPIYLEAWDFLARRMHLVVASPVLSIERIPPVLSQRLPKIRHVTLMFDSDVQKRHAGSPHFNATILFDLKTIRIIHPDHDIHSMTLSAYELAEMTQLLVDRMDGMLLTFAASSTLRCNHQAGMIYGRGHDRFLELIGDRVAQTFQVVRRSVLEMTVYLKQAKENAHKFLLFVDSDVVTFKILRRKLIAVSPSRTMFRHGYVEHEKMLRLTDLSTRQSIYDYVSSCGNGGVSDDCNLEDANGS